LAWVGKDWISAFAHALVRRTKIPETSTVIFIGTRQRNDQIPKSLLEHPELYLEYHDPSFKSTSKKLKE